MAVSITDIELLKLPFVDDEEDPDPEPEVGVETVVGESLGKSGMSGSLGGPPGIDG
jgi:hypothetical protein